MSRLLISFLSCIGGLIYFFLNLIDRINCVDELWRVIVIVVVLIVFGSVLTLYSILLIKYYW